MACFATPHDAIAGIDRLLREHRFDELASYIADPDDETRSGRYFHDPSMGPPFLGGAWRPFRPGSTLERIDIAPGAATATLGLAIDQGDGSVARALWTVRLVERDGGWMLAR